jgi:putative tryptophan/tyrosine transport system substrate-binding protein
MRRRDFIKVIACSTAGWPLAVHAQQSQMPVIGYLSARSREDTTHLIAAFQRGLAENGFVEAQNVAIEYRFAGGQYDKLPAMAKELVQLPVTVIAATGGEPSASAAKAATSTIPVVFAVGSDPVKAMSLLRPSLNSVFLRSQFPLARSLIPAATNSLHWPLTTRCLPFTSFGNTPRRVA